MKSDFELIIKQIKSNDDILIYPISDLHIGAAEFMESAWRDFVKKVKSQKNAYITLGGDMINNTTRNSVSNIFEETMRPREQKKLLTEYLEPLRDKILCAASGNHERRSEKDADNNPMYDVMCKLDLEDVYRPNMAFIKIQIGDTTGAGRSNPTYCIAVTHGAGGGIYTGAGVNRNERTGYFIDGIDALVVGHTHKPVMSKPNKIVIDKHNNNITFKPFYVVTSTSWLEYGGYALQKMLLPASHALQEITLHGNEKSIRVAF